MSAPRLKLTIDGLPDQSIKSADEIADPVFPWDWLQALFLFSATALVVAWQNSRLGVLWDLSYVLENSFRMSLGQVPYREFPFPYPPVTFLIQATLIKLAGRAFWHHVVYCAVMGGGATVLTRRILIGLLRRGNWIPNFEQLAHMRSKRSPARTQF